MSGVKAILEQKKVSELPVVKGQVIEITSTADLESSFKVLLENNILSAPVFDEASKKYLGFLDVRDLVAFSVFATKENNLAASLNELLNHGAKMYAKAQDGITVSYLCRRNPIKSVSKDASLMDVIKILTTGTHRVPVIDENGKITNIISQSSVIRFLLDKCIKDEFFHNTADQLHLGTSPVLSVTEHDTALTAFSKLDSTGRSGLAVVNDHGVITGNTSGSDIKLYLQHRESLNQPINDFLNKIRRLELTTRAPVFTCSGSDKLHTVVEKLAATKAHRVFMVDHERRLQKVISLTDILKVIVKA